MHKIESNIITKKLIKKYDYINEPDNKSKLDLDSVISCEKIALRINIVFYISYVEAYFYIFSTQLFYL